MKTACCLLLGVASLAAPAIVALGTTADAERTAIKAVVEEEKNAYVALDDERMSATWIHEASSVKLLVFAGKEMRIDGYAAIAAHDRGNLARERALDAARRARFEFSNFRITPQGDSAWVVFDAKWEGVIEGVPASGTQSRIYVLRRQSDKWKIALMAISELTFEKGSAPTRPAQ